MTGLLKLAKFYKRIKGGVGSGPKKKVGLPSPLGESDDPDAQTPILPLNERQKRTQRAMLNPLLTEEQRSEPGVEKAAQKLIREDKRREAKQKTKRRERMRKKKKLSFRQRGRQRELRKRQAKRREDVTPMSKLYR